MGSPRNVPVLWGENNLLCVRGQKISQNKKSILKILREAHNKQRIMRNEARVYNDRKS